MRGNAVVLKALNAVLGGEILSINQYFLHARMYQHWGYTRLGKGVYDASLQSMKQADQLVSRLLFLEGIPNFQGKSKMKIGKNVQEMLLYDRSLLKENFSVLNDEIKLCEIETDFVSRDLLECFLKTKEDYFEWLTIQDTQINDFGLDRYLQAQI